MYKFKCILKFSDSSVIVTKVEITFEFYMCPFDHSIQKKYFESTFDRALENWSIIK